MRRFLVLATLIAAVVVPCAVASPASANGGNPAQIDSYCHRTFLSWNHLFNKYDPADGVGLYNYRYAGNVTVYDHCQHGGVEGTIYISPGVIQQKNGKPVLRFYYHTQASGWTSNYLYFKQALVSGNFWTGYEVHTESNIGLPPNGTIDGIYMAGYSVFDVDGTNQSWGYGGVKCITASRTCSS